MAGRLRLSLKVTIVNKQGKVIKEKGASKPFGELNVLKKKLNLMKQNRETFHLTVTANMS